MAKLYEERAAVDIFPANDSESVVGLALSDQCASVGNTAIASGDAQNPKARASPGCCALDIARPLDQQPFNALMNPMKSRPPR